jgi:hypothetical protein
LLLVISTALETMQLGGLAGMTAMTMGISQEKKGKEKKSKD